MLQVAVRTGDTCRSISLEVRLAGEDHTGNADGRIKVEPVALWQVCGTGLVEHCIGEDALVPVVAYGAKDFLSLRRIVLAAVDP